MHRTVIIQLLGLMCWRLLQSQLETKGPGWYSPADCKERLFTNKSNRPGDDMKEALRTDGKI